jgi:bacterioferritin-associated ferredoxin
LITEFKFALIDKDFHFRLGGRTERDGVTVIICICEGVTDREVRERVRRGAVSLDALQQRCGAGGDCGSCRADLRRILRETRSASRSETR